MMKSSKLRAWWSHRQGLDGSMRGKRRRRSSSGRAGRARSAASGRISRCSRVAGRARAGGRGRGDAGDPRAADGAGVYLRLAVERLRARTDRRPDFSGDMKTALKLGVTEKEVDKLCEAVVKALEQGRARPRRHSRGDREGVAQPRRRRQEEGPDDDPAARARAVADGRPDPPCAGQRTSRSAALRVRELDAEPARVVSRVARGGVHGARPAVLPLGRAGDVRRAAMVRGARSQGREAGGRPLGLVPAEPGSDRLLLPDDVAAFRELEAPTTPRYSLVSSLDPITANRREMQSLIDDEDRERPLMVDTVAKPVGGLADLPSHAILDRGQIVRPVGIRPERRVDRVGDVRSEEGQGPRARPSTRRRHSCAISWATRGRSVSTARRVAWRGWSRCVPWLVEFIAPRGSFEIFRRWRGALGSGGHRSRRSSQRALGSSLGQSSGAPLSLTARSTPPTPSAPRLTASIATRTLLVTAHGSRRRPRRASEQPVRA